MTRKKNTSNRNGFAQKSSIKDRRCFARKFGLKKTEEKHTKEEMYLLPNLILKSMCNFTKKIKLFSISVKYWSFHMFNASKGKVNYNSDHLSQVIYFQKNSSNYIYGKRLLMLKVSQISISLCGLSQSRYVVWFG